MKLSTMIIKLIDRQAVFKEGKLDSSASAGANFESSGWGMHASNPLEFAAALKDTFDAGVHQFLADHFEKQ